MKISKVIEHCDECQFGKRFNDANASVGCVFMCMKSAWCELEEYNGDKNVAFFDESKNENE